MSPVTHLLRSLLILAAASVGFDACAQGAGPEPLYDPTQMPATHGTLELFTATPVGDLDGFVLTDGTEVKTPPHLGTDIAGIVAPGDRVTIHGLRAASLPLVQAMSVGNDATGAQVIDVGPRPDRPPSALPRWDSAGPLKVEGRVRMALHGPRGDLNGALLQDGTVLRLPPPEARRFTAVLMPGTMVEAKGLRGTTPYGAFIDLNALGPQGGPLAAIAGHPHGLPPMTPRPGR